MQHRPAPGPASALASLKGTRISVLARDRDDAIRIAKDKAWWPRVYRESRVHPIAEHGRFWFVLADEPISGLEEFARTARTVRNEEED